MRVLLVGGPMYEALYSRIDEFERREGVEVERVLARDHPDLNERIRSEYSSGEADYDLISTHIKYAPGQREWLTPLDEVSDKHLSTFSKETLDFATIDGSLYSVPRNLDVKLLHYRTDLVPEPPASWEELVDLAASLKSEGVAGFAFPGKESGLFGHFFEIQTMYGGRMFSGEGDPAPEITNRAGLAALGILQRLYAEAAPEGAEDWHYDEVAECFASGRAAMSTDWPGGFHIYEESGISGSYGLALYPEGPAGRRMYAGCHSFAIPVSVQDRGLALRLLEHLTTRESQALEARFGTLPARTDSLNLVRSEAEEGTLAKRRWRLLEQARQEVIVPPKHPRYPDVEDTIWRGVHEAITSGDTSLRKLEEVQEKARSAARKAGER